MDLYINSANKTIISDPQFRTPISSISFKRGDSADILISFYDNSGSIETVSYNRGIQFGIKEANVFNGDYVVYTDDITPLSASNQYSVSPSFNTTELNAQLSSNEASVTLMLEITWTDDGGTSWSSTNTIPCIVYNDVIKDGEELPTSAYPPAEWFEAPTLVENVTISGSLSTGGGTPVTIPTLYRDGESGGKPFYNDNPGGVYDYALSWLSSPDNYWYLEDGYTGATWRSYADTSTADSLTLSGVTGTGTAFTTLHEVSTVPPFFRITSDYLYVNDGTNWRRVGLSAF